MEFVSKMLWIHFIDTQFLVFLLTIYYFPDRIYNLHKSDQIQKTEENIIVWGFYNLLLLCLHIFRKNSLILFITNNFIPKLHHDDTQNTRNIP